MSKRLVTEDFIKMSIELFNDKYKAIIICNRHKVEFSQRPDKHLSSKTGGCTKYNR